MELINLYREIEQYDLWDNIYQYMTKASLKFSQEYTKNVATLDENIKKNRYKDILPYDQNRVILQKKVDKSDYINASYVKVDEIDFMYILSQGPVPSTLTHFWQMIFEQNSSIVVMLCNEIEGGRCKCSRYYPTHQDKKFSLGCYKINLVKITEKKGYCVRRISVKQTGVKNEKIIDQFHYSTWPDFGIPDDREVFIEFVDLVRNSEFFATSGPPIVHCSAGIGRSGSYILVDTMIEIIRKKQEFNCFDVLQLLVNMRRGRYGLVQTSEQLKFVYQALITCCVTKFRTLLEKNDGYFPAKKKTLRSEIYLEKSDPFINSNNFFSIYDDMKSIKEKKLKLSQLSLSRQGLQSIIRLKRLSHEKIMKTSAELLLKKSTARSKINPSLDLIQVADAKVTISPTNYYGRSMSISMARNPRAKKSTHDKDLITFGNVTKVEPEPIDILKPKDVKVKYINKKNMLLKKKSSLTLQSFTSGNLEVSPSNNKLKNVKVDESFEPIGHCATISSPKSRNTATPKSDLIFLDSADSSQNKVKNRTIMRTYTSVPSKERLSLRSSQTVIDPNKPLRPPRPQLADVKSSNQSTPVFYDSRKMKLDDQFKQSNNCNNMKSSIVSNPSDKVVTSVSSENKNKNFWKTEYDINISTDSSSENIFY